MNFLILTPPVNLFQPLSAVSCLFDRSHLESPVLNFLLCVFNTAIFTLHTHSSWLVSRWFSWIASTVKCVKATRLLKHCVWYHFFHFCLYSRAEIHTHQKWNRVTKSVTLHFGMAASIVHCISEAMGTSTNLNWHREGHSHWLSLSWPQLSYCDLP